MKNITIKDVAREAKVSTTLVSRVMNATPDKDGVPVCAVNKATAARILAVVERMGYRPNAAAANLRKKTRKRIGVILPDISHPYFASMAREFEDLARKEGYTVLFGSSLDRAEIIENLALTFMVDNADGIILIPGVNCDGVVEKIVNHHIPLVLAVRNLPDIKRAGRVIPDNAKATSLVLNHIISSGCRHIDMVSSTLRVSTITEREKLFSEQMVKLKIPYRILHCDQNMIDESVDFIVEDIRRRKTDAIYCPNESIPLSIVKSCRKRGVRIPEDIALVGYDGGISFDITTPTITQISFPRRQVAQQAFNILQEMAGNDAAGIPEVLVEPELIIGESTNRHSSVEGSGNPAGSPLCHLEQAIDEILLAKSLM